jgi:ribosomal protein S11
MPAPTAVVKKKKITKIVPKGALYVTATFNNTW